MSGTRIIKRWTWEAIILLIALNALLWAPFALSAGRFRLNGSRPPSAGCPAPSPR
jgi:hypothetical protein